MGVRLTKSEFRHLDYEELSREDAKFGRAANDMFQKLTEAADKLFEELELTE